MFGQLSFYLTPLQGRDQFKVLQQLRGANLSISQLLGSNPDVLSTIMSWEAVNQTDIYIYIYRVLQSVLEKHRLSISFERIRKNRNIVESLFVPATTTKARDKKNKLNL